MATNGQCCWPLVGRSVAAYGYLVTADDGLGMWVYLRSESSYLHQCGRNPLMLRLLTPVLRSTKVVIIAEEPGRDAY